MELLATYSSEDSDDSLSDLQMKAKNSSAEACSSSADYFNLQESSYSTEHPKNSQFLDSYNIMEQAEVLTTKTYGPSGFKSKEVYVQNKDTKTNDSQQNLSYKQQQMGKRQCRVSPYPCKVLRNTNYEENSLVFSPLLKCISDKKANNESENSTVSQTFTNNVPKEEENIYYIDRKIYTQMRSSSYCRIPQHQLKSYLAHESPVTSLYWCIPQYSHLLLSSSLDSTIKVWDINNADCVWKLNTNGGIKSAKWSLSGTKIVYGGFGKQLHIFDITTGKDLLISSMEQYVSSIQVHPELVDIILVGTKNKVLAFDERTPTAAIRSFTANCQYVLDIAFLNQGQEFVASTEIVSHDSSDRTLMVWDFPTGALMSNQIYCERYTCPCLAVEPGGKHFVAQSNGNYIVTFLAKRPYKMLNKCYANHKVSGYSIGCDFSTDGNFLASGDSCGALCIYSNQSGDLIKKIDVKHDIPTIRINWHPVLPSTVAVASWDGSIDIWK